MDFWGYSMTIDKQALRISELEELNELLREKVKKLESDLWDKEQLRHVYSEKSFDLQCKVRELEARNQKDFVWRGKEISRLNDEVDELKEKLGAAEMQIVNLKQNCENDPRIHEIVDLKESVAELATENVGMKELIEQHANSVAVCPNCSHEEPSETDDIVALYRSMETTATDAFLAEVRAHGVEMFSEKFGGGTLISDMVKEIAKDFAAQLRKGGAA